jgi:hypothetical protein
LDFIGNPFGVAKVERFLRLALVKDGPRASNFYQIAASGTSQPEKSAWKCAVARSSIRPLRAPTRYAKFHAATTNQ